MRQEARALEADWFKGEWTTLVTYALLAREWPRLRAAPGPSEEAGGGALH